MTLQVEEEIKKAQEAMEEQRLAYNEVGGILYPYALWPTHCKKSVVCLPTNAILISYILKTTLSHPTLSSKQILQKRDVKQRETEAKVQEQAILRDEAEAKAQVSTALASWGS